MTGRKPSPNSAGSTPTTVDLLVTLLDDPVAEVRDTALISLGRIGEYRPGLLDPHGPQVLEFAGHCKPEPQLAAIQTLGKLIAFRGLAKSADYPETVEEVRQTLVGLCAARRQEVFEMLKKTITESNDG